MAQHTVTVSYDTAIQIKDEILHKDITIEVKADGDKLDIIKISKGGFDWLPKYGKKDKPRSWTWKKFVELMEQNS